MVRAFYCKELTRFTTDELHEYLSDADQFAAGKTAPGRTTLGYAWCECFPERHRAFIQAAAECIPRVAARLLRGQTDGLP